MTFEQSIADVETKSRKPGRFKELCASIFQGVEGAELLAFLCAAEHPLDHTPGASDHQHGRREVIAALWRNGAGTNVIHTIQTDGPRDTREILAGEQSAGQQPERA